MGKYIDLYITKEEFDRRCLHGDLYEGYVIGMGYAYYLSSIVPPPHLKGTDAGSYAPIYCAPNELLYTQYIDTSSDAVRRSMEANSTDYTVKRGDTLSDIARRHSVSINELVDWNNIAHPDKIFVGQRLIVSRPKAEAPMNDARPQTAAVDTNAYSSEVFSFKKTFLKYLMAEGVGVNAALSVHGLASVCKSGEAYYANVSASATTPSQNIGSVTYFGAVEVFKNGISLGKYSLLPIKGLVYLNPGWAMVGENSIPLPPNGSGGVYLEFDVSYTYNDGTGYSAPLPSNSKYRLQIGFNK